MSVRNLIFDFDGVLADTWDACCRSKAAVEGITIAEAIQSNVRYYSSPQHGRKQQPSPKRIQEYLEWTALFGEEMRRIGFPLFHAFVQELQTFPNDRLAIVSNGSHRYITNRVPDIGLSFTHILAIEDSLSKEEKVETICADWGVGLRDAYYFTDTASDVLELEQLLDRTKIIGCAWGYQGYEGLARLLPEDQIMREPSDIRRVLGRP